MSNVPDRVETGIVVARSEIHAPGAGRIARWPEIRELAELAEAIGVDALWVPDHLLFRRAGSVVIPDGETRGIWEAWTILSALAAVTTRVTLGPMVACTAFRNPALLAKQAATLDEVSGGRLQLGLGAGWHQPEFDAFGYPWDHLVGRFDEALQITVPLLREGRVDFVGKYFQAPNCELRPRGPQPGGPPIWIGAHGPRMLKLVARWADAYNGVMHATPDTLAETFAALDAACREIGRDPATLRRTVGCFVALPGAEDDPAGIPERAIRGTPEQVAERFEAFRQAGVSHMSIFLSPWNARGLEAFARTVELLRR